MNLEQQAFVDGAKKKGDFAALSEYGRRGAEVANRHREEARVAEEEKKKKERDLQARDAIKVAEEAHLDIAPIDD